MNLNAAAIFMASLTTTVAIFLLFTNEPVAAGAFLVASGVFLLASKP